MSKWIILLILTSLGRVPVVYNSFTVSTIEQDSLVKFILLLLCTLSFQNQNLY